MISHPKIFIAGGTGFLGRRVIEKINKKKDHYCTTSLSLGVDFRDKKQTEKYIQKEKPSIVIHCAAYIGGITF